MAGVGVTTRKGAPVNIAISLQEPERTAQKNALFGASMKPRSRKGAHNVTRICNLEAYGLAPEPGTSTRGCWRALRKALLPRALGDELKKKLNCTVYIEDMPGKNAVTSAYPAAGSTVSSRAQVKEKMLQLQGHVPSLQSSACREKGSLVSAQVDQEFAQFLEQRLEMLSFSRPDARNR